MIWRIYYRATGAHVHCRVFCGPAHGALGLAGELTFRPREFTEFTQLRKVLGVEFVTEMREDGSPDLDHIETITFAPLV